MATGIRSMEAKTLLEMLTMLLAFGACTLVGQLSAAKLKNRMEGLEQMSLAVYQLGLMIRYVSCPLAQATARVGQRLDNAFFIALSGRLKENRACQEAWEDTMSEARDKDARFAALTARDREILSVLAAELGRSDGKTQQQQIELAHKELSVQVEEAKEHWIRKGQVYKTLGLMGGLAAAIILW